MLFLVQRQGMDRCFRCSKPITEPEDLSFDHIKDWLDVNPALFWDRKNIAFSHQRCNSKSGRRPTKVEWTDTHRHCFACKQMKPFEAWSDSKRMTRDAACRECTAASDKARRERKAQERARKARGNAAPDAPPVATAEPPPTP